MAYIAETLVARRSLFERIGDFDTTLPTAGDVDWYARVVDAGVVGHVCDHVLLHKRVHNSNTSLMDGDNNGRFCYLCVVLFAVSTWRRPDLMNSPLIRISRLVKTTVDERPWSWHYDF